MIQRLVAILLLLTATAAAEPWTDHTRAGEYAFATADYDRAEREFRAALNTAQTLPAGDHRLATSLENLGRFFEHRSRFDEAQPMYQLLLAALESKYGDASPHLIDTLAAVGRVALGRGEVPTANESLRRYVAIADATGAADPADLAQVLGLLARSLTLQESADEALGLQRRAVRLMVSDDTLDDVAIANAMESLAQLELKHGTAEAAEQLLLDSVERRREGGEFADPSITLAAAAGTAFASGAIDAAEKLGVRALDHGGQGTALAEDVLVDVSWFKVRRSSQELVDILGSAKGDPDAAVAAERLQSQVDRLDADPSSDAVALATARSRLLAVHTMLGDLVRAVPMQRAVVASAPTAAAGITAQRNLVALLAANGDTAAAVEANESLIADIEASSGLTSAALLAPLEQHLDLLTELGEKKRARKVKKRLKKLRRALR